MKKIVATADVAEIVRENCLEFRWHQYLEFLAYGVERRRIKLRFVNPRAARRFRGAHAPDANRYGACCRMPCRRRQGRSSSPGCDLTDAIVHASEERAGSREIVDAEQVRVTGGVSAYKQIQLALFLASDRSNRISGRLIHIHDDWRRLEQASPRPAMAGQWTICPLQGPVPLGLELGTAERCLFLICVNVLSSFSPSARDSRRLNRHAPQSRREATSRPPSQKTSTSQFGIGAENPRLHKAS